MRALTTLEEAEVYADRCEIEDRPFDLHTPMFYDEWEGAFPTNVDRRDIEVSYRHPHPVVTLRDAYGCGDSNLINGDGRGHGYNGRANGNGLSNSQAGHFFWNSVPHRERWP